MQKLAIEYLLKTKERFPEKIAIVDGEQCITFFELWNKSISLAYWITTEFQITNQPISVNLSKSIDAVISLLAIQLAGNIYVPLDIDTPHKRKEKILKTLCSNWVLEQKAGEFTLAGKSFSITNDSQESDTENSILEKLSARKSSDPLYIIFTSGTTGTPKGVTISNASVIDYIEWAIETYDVSEMEIIGNQAPFYFDNSVLDLYLMLAKGSTLHLLSKNALRFPDEFRNYISENKINFIFFVPSVLNNLIALKALQGSELTCLKKVLFAGEPMPMNTLISLRRELPGALLSNLYGPTEITVDAIYWIFGNEINDLENVPLGVPCNNHRILFMDENDKFVKDENVTAEICISGPGVSLGYWNEPEMTRQVFIPDLEKQGQFIYKTGDLGYVSSKDGLVYMTGRKDDQFKHLGYRIEPGEIENALNRLDGIQQSCVFYDSPQKCILAFYTGEKKDSSFPFKNFLSKMLPTYMIPHSYHQVDRFPMNRNEKIDRKSFWISKKDTDNAI
ncbi:MAG: amino acid adenylation domain-containing protein [Nitrospinae bacterium]|nr:amino acid adenylation domain-containing protein [Nitrospinota bacterium]